MRQGFFRLEGHTVVPCPSEHWSIREVGRKVADTVLGEIWIATDFIGMNMDPFQCDPVRTFETAIMYGEDDTEALMVFRTATWEEAEREHQRAVRYVCSLRFWLDFAQSRIYSLWWEMREAWQTR